MTAGIDLHRGTAPLLISIPHAGSAIPPEIAERLADPWLARKDCDWHVDRLWAFAAAKGATMIRTPVSRTVIDLNRDPSGASLYPGQSVTALCPTATFDGEPLYAAGLEPEAAEIAARREAWFDPYHAALAAEIARLRALHGHVVLVEAHAIRSTIPLLFADELPNLNIGTNSGRSCAPELALAVDDALSDPRFSRIVDGRFKGGWTTRHYGRPPEGVHAVQIEIAFRSYLDEPAQPDPSNWPPAFDAGRAAPLAALLAHMADACIRFAKETR